MSREFTVSSCSSLLKSNLTDFSSFKIIKVPDFKLFFERVITEVPDFKLSSERVSVEKKRKNIINPATTKIIIKKRIMNLLLFKFSDLYVSS